MSPYTIDYNDVAPFLSTRSDGGIGVESHLNNPAWGQFSERNFVLENVKVFSFKADLHRPFRIHYVDDAMPRMVNLCLATEGEILVEFPQVKAGLESARHHGMYIAETRYDVVTQKIDVAHIEVDREYFTGLLCDSERWSAALKERLYRKETVLSGIGKINSAMQRTLFDLFNAPLTGSLHKLLIEAKVLELLALQLEQFAYPYQVKPARDRDVFMALRDYLDQSFLQEHSLKDLARQFAINEFKLKKGFRDNFQTSVFSYLLHKRLEHARFLLLDVKRNVGEVARQIGYKNPNHFSTAFKKKFGFSPATLKK